jgi:Cu/Ag efflux protein CusF
MKRIIGMCLAGMLVCGAANVLRAEEGGATAAKEKPAKTEKQSKTGTVQKVDVEGKKLTVMVARELTFTVAADTKIAQGDAARTLADIKVGDNVTVEYTRVDKETRAATKITINPAAVAPAAEPKK